MVVVGWDGATFDLIGPWIAEGKLPTFARLLADGAHGDLRSTLPTSTPSASISATTGTNPGAHNVYGCSRIASEGRGGVPVSCADVRGRRVWDIATDYGKRVAVLGLPLTQPATPLHGGFMVPERKIDDLRAFRDDAFARQRTALAETLELLERRPWDLLWASFDGLDSVQRSFWHFMDPSHPAHPRSSDLRDTVLEIYQLLDEGLAEMTKRLDDRTGLLVVSGHGACGLESYVLLPRWLEAAGYLVMKDDGPSSTPSVGGSIGAGAYALVRALRQSGLGWLPNLLAQRPSPKEPAAKASFVAVAGEVDWSATRVYCPLPAEGGLRVNLRGREANGIVAPGDLARVCDEVGAALLALVDPATGRKVVRAVHRRDELYRGPHVENAPDLLVEPYDAYGLIDGTAAASIVPSGRCAGEPTGNRRRTGMFVLTGQGVRRGVRTSDGDVCDVAPTVLHLLGLPVQADMDGTVATAALTPAHLAAHPVRTDQVGTRHQSALLDVGDREQRSIEGTQEGIGYP
jgi:predicted AlkP superfamily phosphohydrolase/phosphomutase